MIAPKQYRYTLPQLYHGMGAVGKQESEGVRREGLDRTGGISAWSRFNVRATATVLGWLPSPGVLVGIASEGGFERTLLASVLPLLRRCRLLLVIIFCSARQIVAPCITVRVAGHITPRVAARVAACANVGVAARVAATQAGLVRILRAALAWPRWRRRQPHEHLE
jgi:hypothetical protein